MSNIAPIPSNRRSRRCDPRTSVEAARRVAKASLPALRRVEALMQDGLERTDEDIWQEARQQNFKKTLSTIQHGRLALSEAGILLDTGRERLTTNGSPSRLWVFNKSWTPPAPPPPVPAPLTYKDARTFVRDILAHGIVLCTLTTGQFQQVNPNEVLNDFGIE